MNDTRDDEILTRLGAYGADLSRWPTEARGRARAALLERPDFRRAWEKEQELDRTIGEARAGIDAAISASRQVERIKRCTLSRLSNPLAGMRWRRVAAAVLAAAVLGGAADLLLPDRAPEPAEAAILDPLLGVDGSEV